tara:strand:+ start:1518 stop:2219 length:702 start_codon:yes stop_codon:yes gene_type:complete
MANEASNKFMKDQQAAELQHYKDLSEKPKPQGLSEFTELSISEIEQLGPTERQEYLRRKAARDASGVEGALAKGAEAQAAQAKRVPAELRQQLATSMMGLTGGGLAGGLGAMGQMAKTVTPAATQASLQATGQAAQSAADAKAAGVETATYMAEQGVGSKAALKSDVKQRIENIKKDLRNWLTGIDNDDLEREMQALKSFYTDDAGNIDPEISAYIDEQTTIEKKEASGWDIF